MPALTTLTWNPDTINVHVPPGAPPAWQKVTSKLTGDQPFTGATLSIAAGEGRIVQLHTKTINDGGEALIEIDTRGVRATQNSVLVRAAKDDVYADLTINVTSRPPLLAGRSSKGRSRAGPRARR